MPITPRQTRFAGLLTNCLAIALLTLPIPTHAATQQPLQPLSATLEQRVPT